MTYYDNNDNDDQDGDNKDDDGDDDTHINNSNYMDTASGSLAAKNYTGSWRNGLKHGSGTIFWRNGDM